MTADAARTRKDTTSPAETDATGGSTHALRGMLEGLTYEVMPFKGTAELVLAHVPETTRITVTASPTRGLEPTIALAETLAGKGYTVAPHLAARMIADEAELRDIVARLSAAKVSTIFVIAGDADQSGDFADALGLLRALDRIGHEFGDVGVAGYPEGHPAIKDEDLWRALQEKAPYADHVVSQVCFDPRTTLSWAREVRARGVDLPIRIGIPGAVSRQRLVRISARIGLGDSARFLKKQQSMFWRFFLPSGYSPERLVKRLGRHLTEDDTMIRALHIYTFNELAATEAWRRKLLDGLAASPTPRPSKSRGDASSER